MVVPPCDMLLGFQTPLTYLSSGRWGYKPTHKWIAPQCIRGLSICWPENLNGCLVVLNILKNMKVNGKDYPIYEMENKKCLEPPSTWGCFHYQLRSGDSSSLVYCRRVTQNARSERASTTQSYPICLLAFLWPRKKQLVFYRCPVSICYAFPDDIQQL